MKSTSLRLVVAIVLCLAGAWISGLLLAQHHGEGAASTAVNQLCGEPGATSGCETVAKSAWSSMAGVPLALLGVFFYVSLALLLALALAAPAGPRRTAARLGLGLLTLGLLFDLYLLGLQLFSIHAYCSLCITTYVVSGLVAATLWSLADPFGRAARARAAQPAPPPPPDSPDDTLPAHAGSADHSREARLVLAGWILGSLVLALGLASAEAALVEREKGRVLGMIGGPVAQAPAPARNEAPQAATTPPPAGVGSPSPAPTASVAEGSGSAQWQTEAKRLQGILDDPEKLEQYFSDKAQKEFDATRPVKIAVDLSRGKGPADAPVEVVEFSDFLCPFCRNVAAAFGNFIPLSGNRVRVQFMNYPLDQSCNTELKATVHPGACVLALGSVCAHKQGKFWPYHDRVFGQPLQSPKPADVVRLAGEAGLNAAAMEGCLSDTQTKAELAMEIAEGNRLKVNATPFLFINGKHLPRVNDFVLAVDKEARKKGFPPLPAAQGGR